MLFGPARVTTRHTIERYRSFDYARCAQSCAVEGGELEFVLNFSDYVEECRAAGVEPLSFDALRGLIAALTNSVTIH